MDDYQKQILLALDLNNAPEELQQATLISFNKILMMKLGLFINDSLTDQQQFEFNQLVESTNDMEKISQWFSQNLVDSENLFKLALEDTVNDIKSNLI